MTINISGILKSPQGSPIQNAEIIFEQTRTSTEVLAGTKFSIITNQSGNYSTTIGVGTFVFKVRFQDETQYRTVASNVIVTQSMNNYTLNQIIQDQSQLQDVDYDLLQDVIQARDQAAASAQTAQASQSTATAKASEASASAYAALASKNSAQTSEANALQSKDQAHESQQMAQSSQSQANLSSVVSQSKASEAANSAAEALSDKNTAQQQADSALSSKVQAGSFQQQAGNSQQQQQQSQGLANSKAQEAQDSQVSQQSNQLIATNKADQASTSQAQAYNSQSTSIAKAEEAATSQSAAQGSQILANTKAQESSQSQVLAQRWAANPENTEVSGGLYSALHYAAKAAQSAQTATGQLVWRGGWSAQSGTTPPNPSGTAQDFYRITQAGSILGVTYEVGDYIHWDNINSIWFKMDGTDSVVSVNGRTGQVTLDQDQVGALPAQGTAVQSHKLATARTISITGDGAGSATFDGSADQQVSLSLKASGVTPGVLTKVTVNQKGIVTQGEQLQAQDIPNLDWGKITTGKPTTLQGYGITDAVSSTGVASTANKLAVPRQINGTNFDGTQGITTEVWGSSRQITIGNTQKDVNGSQPVSWSLSEIGAFPAAGGNVSGGIIAKSHVIAESANGSSGVGIEAPDNVPPYISAKVNNLPRKVMEFTGGGDVIFAGSAHVQRLHAAVWGDAIHTVGGKLRSDDTSFLSLDGKTYSFVTSIGDAHLCQNSYWNGASWLKHDNAQPSGYLFVNRGQLLFNHSDAGSPSPLQYTRQVYHTGYKPSPADIGAANIKDVYHKNSTYTRQEIEQLGKLRINDTRGAVQTPNAFEPANLVPWFSELNGPTGGWYSGINMRGWSETYAGWQLVSGSDLPDLQNSDAAKTALWFRTGSGAAWGEYQKVYTSLHKPTAQDVSAIPINRVNGTPVAAYYTDATLSSVGTKIVLPFTTNAGTMVSFTVRVYQNYQTADIQVSGYLYSAIDNWHVPKAIMIAGSLPVEVKMGRDSDGKAYVHITGAAYRGIGIFDVVSGYVGADWNSGWVITQSDVTPNLALDITIHPPYSPDNKPSIGEIGGAPAGFGLGTYGTVIDTILGDSALLRASGFYRGASIGGLPSDGHPWKYLFSQAHEVGGGAYYGYFALDYSAEKAWVGAQENGVQKINEICLQGSRIIAARPFGNDYHQGAIEVRGDGAANNHKPTVGFHQQGIYAGSLTLWADRDFRFHTQGLTDYAGIMVGLANVSDVYVRSDARLKTNLTRVENALDKVDSLTAYQYDKKQTLQSKTYDRHEVGLIAQDVEKVLPEAINRVIDSNDESGTEVLSISNSAMIALLVQAVKELREELQELKGGRQ